MSKPSAAANALRVAGHRVAGHWGAEHLPNSPKNLYHIIGCVRCLQQGACCPIAIPGQQQAHPAWSELIVCCFSGIVDDVAEPAAVKPKRWGKNRPFHGKVVAVEGLCKLASTHDKDTIRVEIDLGESGLLYTPGDALGVYPLNCQQVCIAN